MSALVAHRRFAGSYKWVLRGDDDTVFFWQGVLKAVEGLNPDQVTAVSWL